MAATDLSAITQFGTNREVTLSATPGKLRRVLVPTNVDFKLSVYAVTTAAKYLDGDVTTADEVDIGAAAYAPIPADQWIEVTTFHRIDGYTFFSLASDAVAPLVRVRLDRV